MTLLSFPRSVPSVFAARAVGPQRQAKGGMHNGLMTSPCATTVPNSLQKVLPAPALFPLTVRGRIWEANWTFKWKKIKSDDIVSGTHLDIESDRHTIKLIRFLDRPSNPPSLTPSIPPTLLPWIISGTIFGAT